MPKKFRKVKGRTYREMEEERKDDKVYPTLHLSFEDLPEAEDWEVGSNYTLEIEVKQTSMRKDDDVMMDSGATFEVRGIKVLGEGKVKSRYAKKR